MSVAGAGQRLRAEQFPPAVEDYDDTDQDNISSTTYTAGSPTVGVHFRAPTSGRVLVLVRCDLRNNAGSTTDRLEIAPRVYIGEDATGESVQNPADSADDAFKRGAVSRPISTSAGYYTIAGSCLVEDLEGGRSYFAEFRYAVTAGSSIDVSERRIAVLPVT